MIELCKNPLILIDDKEIEWQAIRAQGAGGQNVNKVSSAVHLRFDIRASSLPEDVKLRLLGKRDSRVTQDGIVVIKGQQYRTQEKNLQDAIARLGELVCAAAQVPRRRKPTRPSKSSVRERLDNKRQRARQKALRRRVDQD